MSPLLLDYHTETIFSDVYMRMTASVVLRVGLDVGGGSKCAIDPDIFIPSIAQWKRG